MKRWNEKQMLNIGKNLFAKIHRRKHFANHNHDVHFLARKLDAWLTDGVKNLISGTYTPRHITRYYFQDETVAQLY